LSTSIGKTYYSRDFAVINSVLYDYIPVKMEVVEGSDSSTGLDYIISKFRWCERKYVNLGLLFGYKRSSGVEEGEVVDVTQLGVLHQALKESCPEVLFDRVTMRFIGRHDSLLKSKSVEHIPWYVPYWAGGLGLVHHSDKGFSEFERQAVSWIKKQWHDINCRPVDLPKAAEWQMHKVVQDRLNRAGINFDCGYRYGRYINNGLVFDLETTFQKCYKYLTIETLFADDLDTIRKKVDKMRESQRTRTALKQNQILWEELYRAYVCGELKNCKLATDDEIRHQRKIDHIPILCNIL
jgi:hypothetical protein